MAGLASSTEAYPRAVSRETTVRHPGSVQHLRHRPRADAEGCRKLAKSSSACAPVRDPMQLMRTAETSACISLEDPVENVVLLTHAPLDRGAPGGWLHCPRDGEGLPAGAMSAARATHLARTIARRRKADVKRSCTSACNHMTKGDAVGFGAILCQRRSPRIHVEPRCRVHSPRTWVFIMSSQNGTGAFVR